MMHDAQLLSYGFCPLPNGREGLGLAAPVVFLKTDQIIQWFMQMPEAAQVQRAGFNIAALSDVTPIAQFQLSLRSVGDNGSPGNVLMGVGGLAQKNFVASSLGFQFFTLDHFYNASWGEFICIELKPNLVTPPPDPPNFNNGIDVIPNVAGFSSPRINTPYCHQLGFDSDALSKWPIVALQSATKTYGYPVAALAIPQEEINRPCMRFKLPSGFGTTFKVAGVRLRMGTPNAANDFTLAIWKDGTTNPLQQTTPGKFKGGWIGAGDEQAARGDVYFPESLATLDYGTEYFLGFEGLSTAALFGVVVADESHMDAFPGGREVYFAHFNNGSWVRVKTRRLFWDLILAAM